jgi:predicted phage terminase large subunit-like protein
MYIEDKSSGVGLIQEMQRQNLKVVAIPRNIDKVTRAMNCSPEIMAGNVVLCSNVRGVNVIIDEATAFPNGINDDAFDCAMSAIELEFIDKRFALNCVLSSQPRQSHNMLSGY